MKKIIWSLVYMFVAAQICPAQSVLYFPQIVDGTNTWNTAIAITNTAAPGTPAASGTITLTQDNGTPMNIKFTDLAEQPVGSGNTIPFQVAGGQTRLFQSTGASPVVTSGFATVVSDLPVTGTAVFMEFGADGTRIGEAGVPAAAAVKQQVMLAVKFDEGPGRTSTSGIAVANPGNAPANITIQPLDMNGAAVLPPVTKTLPANNHTAFLFTDLFPDAPKEVFGTLRITSDAAVAATTLLIESSGMFATLPVFPLQ